MHCTISLMKIFKSKVTDLIKQRTSVRTYSDKTVSHAQTTALKKFISALEVPPFGTKIRFVLLTASPGQQETLQKMVTYGMIKNPAGFIVGAAEKNKGLHEDFGYLMEQIILFAADSGLGTCWLGGTFRKGLFADAVESKENELIPAVVALGIPASQSRIRDKVIAAIIKARKRLLPERLFFHSDFDTPLNLDNLINYREPLEMVRLAPSASNKQPWRIIYSNTDGKFHFYLHRDESYDPERKKPPEMADLQKIDMGIAMCHFELTARELNLKGKWEALEPCISTLPKHTEYLITWVAEKHF